MPRIVDLVDTGAFLFLNLRNLFAKPYLKNIVNRNISCQKL